MGASASQTGLSSQATEPQASPPVGLQSLARRCEQAIGPDRELDLRIEAATNPQYDGLDEEHARWLTKYGGHPHYTASLDAAMTLVPQDIGSLDGDYWRPEVSRTHRGTWEAMVIPPWNSERNSTVFKSKGDEASAALAMCAAGLKARAAIAAYEAKGDIPSLR